MFAGAKEDAVDNDNDADFRAPSQNAMDMQMDAAVSRHIWDRYFGREVDEDLRCHLWVHTRQRNTTSYLPMGAIVTADFDEHTFPSCLVPNFSSKLAFRDSVERRS